MGVQNVRTEGRINGFFMGKIKMAVERISASVAHFDERPYTTLINETMTLIPCPVAFSIYVYLQTKPEGWLVRRKDVMTRFSIGRDRYDKAIKKLKDIGLVSHNKKKCEGGKITAWELVIHYEPQH